MLKQIVAFIAFLAICSSFFAQVAKPISIEWNLPQLAMDGDISVLIPSIKGQVMDGKRPNFYYNRQVGASTVKAKFTLMSTEPATTAEIDYLKNYGIQVGALKYELEISNAGNERYLVLNLLPYILQNSTVVRIKEFDIELVKGVSSKDVAKEFAVNSVLMSGTGEWYKITVDKDGIYKIDKPFLESLGIDVDNLNPQHINIYGNGDGLLPELNSDPRTDDLAKNSIQVIGELDGVFDNGDYILFYGWGPHRWDANGTTDFSQVRHVYSDVSSYFININAADTPDRIESVFNSGSPVTDVVTDYSYYDVHELDLVSLVNGGKRWYGELFDVNLNRTIAFNVSDIISTSPAFFEVSVASNASSSTGTSQTYSIGGTQLFTAGLPSGSDYGRSTSTMQYDSPTSSLPLLISIVRTSPNILTYLDKITLNARRSLKFTSTQFNFRDLSSVGIGNVAQYAVANLPASTGFVWEVTDRHHPARVAGSFSGADYGFQLDADSLRDFVASNGTSYYQPQSVGQVDHQNLHGLDQADYLIITHPSFVAQANRLANLHRNNGVSVHVVTTDQVYNEFSSGMVDATAIRSFAKMFYDRGDVLPGTKPKYLLLFGDGTYDPKNRVPNNNNYILTYQMDASDTSEDHIGNMPSDDYFGMLDDSDAMQSTNLLDIGVGRLLISDNQIAKEQVDKIEHYMHNGSNLFSTATTNCSSDNGSSTFGDWRTKYVLIADDEEGNYFLNNDVEPQFEYISDSLPEMNCEKIYLDAFQQVATAGGSRYPDVNKAINEKIERGALFVNYVGHGGEVGVAEERVITVPQIQDWRNIDVLPLFVSATCEFTKFDDPDRVSAGEWASLNPYGAAIALMTTTRSVFFSVNTNIGQSFIRNVFKRNSNFEPRTFGEIIAATKSAVGGNNKRSFTLIGDPALKIALPQMQIVTDSINGVDPAVTLDTINALSKVT
ncbi:MAG: type IX secretion system sortase PorU, partial [Crocinitomicaceae bacterium]|nr:type IX secretion system sortase PorU [Crocinitomicaceae bacterium]